MSAAFVPELRAQPTATVALLRQRLLGTGSGGGSYSALDLAVHFRDLARHDQGQVKDLVGEQTWFTLLASGLLDIYVDVVSAPNFFSRLLDLVSDILSAFTIYCEEVEDDPSVAIPLLARDRSSLDQRMVQA